jgi:hypothetical protein
MPPRKIFFLLIRGTLSEVHMAAMGFPFPPIIENYFIVIPDVIVIVIAVVNCIASADARRTS